MSCQLRSPRPHRAKAASSLKRCAMLKLRIEVVAAVLGVLSAARGAAQSAYQVISVSDGGTISGTVKWTGPLPKIVPMPINKDAQVCDPQSQKMRDLERLTVATNGGVANTLHTVHMTGASDYNLPFPFANQTVTRTMNRQGLVDLRCNAGHVWMNAEMMVVPHPYYAVTDEDGNFRLTNVPPGEYEIEAWHEGWKVVGHGELYDVMTQMRVQRPVFSDPVEWTKRVSVPANGNATVNFAISDKRPEMASNQ